MNWMIIKSRNGIYLYTGFIMIKTRKLIYYFSVLLLIAIYSFIIGVLYNTIDGWIKNEINEWNLILDWAYFIVFSFMFLIICIAIHTLLTLIYPYPRLTDIKKVFVKWRDKNIDLETNEPFDSNAYSGIIGKVEIGSIKHTKLKSWLILLTVIDFYEDIY